MTVVEPVSVTYTVVPSGVTAMPRGFGPGPNRNWSASEVGGDGDRGHGVGRIVGHVGGLAVGRDGNPFGDTAGCDGAAVRSGKEVDRGNSGSPGDVSGLAVWA